MTLACLCNILRLKMVVKNDNFPMKKVITKADITSTHNLCLIAKIRKTMYTL